MLPSILFMVILGNAQSPTNSPTPERGGLSPQESQRRDSEVRRKREQEFERIKSISSGEPKIGTPRISGVIPKANTERSISQVPYRASTKEELQFLAPEKAMLEKFAAFLKNPKTGLVRLVKDKECADGDRVVSVTPECQQYEMPGGGSSYSFRTRDYRIRRLADLMFTNENFRVPGVLSQGIIVGIGDVALESTTLDTTGLKFLIDFQPTADVGKLKEPNSELFAKGVLSEGFIYRRELKAVENMTYVLRSIAFNGYSLRSKGAGIFNELDFDKRYDIIVALRIVKKYEDGSVAILWKELSRIESPRVKETMVEVPTN